MTRNTVCSLLALAGLTLSLAVTPLTAQSTPPNTQPSGTAGNPPANATNPKKTKSKKATTVAKDANAASTTTPAPAAKTAPAAAAKTMPAASPAAAAPPQKGMVWVNTSSGVYHSSGSKYYGKTKQGKYMTEADAQKAGFHAAKGETP